MQAHPKRFGLFASLPLPDVDGAMKELNYAFDELHADGVVMETSTVCTWVTACSIRFLPS